MLKSLFGKIVLFVASIIWGLAFVFQRKATGDLGTFTINGTRFLLGALVLSPFLFIKRNYDIKEAIKGGLVTGFFLFLATNCQQYALIKANSGHAGFITAQYIILVPIFNFLFFHKRISRNVIIALIMSFFGLYLICGLSDLNFDFNDFFLIACAGLFSFQIIYIDIYSTKVEPVILSFFQFLVAGLTSMVMAFFFDTISLEALSNSMVSILYLGVMSTGLAYTFQTIGQRDVEPTVASIIMSLESAFSLLFGFLVLHEVTGPKELLGCLVMFIAVILAQL